MKKKLIASGILMALSTSVFAEDGIKSSVELGLVLTSGNTKTQSGNIKGKIEQTKGKFRNTLAAEALYIDGEEGRLSEKYLGSGKSAYQFDAHNYAYVSGNGERDLFSGFDYQASISAGYGYRAIDSKAMTLDFEIGPGYRESKPDNDDAEGELIGRAAGLFAYRFNETATFTEELVSEFGDDATITKSVTALTAQVVGNMAMKASLTARHNSNAPEDFDELDTETAITLVFTF